ncbi:uncharacterized mitochondrial protein-like protein [Tanacetum coccineum]
MNVPASSRPETRFLERCYSDGISRMLMAPYAPQQNGIVERRNRTLIEMTRTPTRALVGVTPYEKFYGEKPNLEDLKVFGCVAYERIMSKHLKKLDDRSKPLVYLGKEPSSGGFWLYNPRENKIIISVYVLFDDKKGWIWKTENSIQEGREPGTFTVLWAAKMEKLSKYGITMLQYTTPLFMLQ